MAIATVTGSNIQQESRIPLTDGLKQPKSVITNLRGVVNFGDLTQFDFYIRGYALLSVINAPFCMSEAVQNGNNGGMYTTLQESFVDILENEFRSLDGINDMEGDTSDVTDGISTMQLITKVTEQSGSSVTIGLIREKAGRTISKYIEYFLRCVKDPRSQFKTYLGAITPATIASIKPGFDKEVFNLLYIVTDDTGFEIEGAYLMLCAQPTTANLSMLEATKGEHDFVDVSTAWNVFPVRSIAINNLAKSYVDNLDGIVRDSTNMEWALSTGNGVYKVTRNAEAGTGNATYKAGTYTFN